MAIPKECKRLAEVDFPLATVTKYSAIEKSKKTGTVAAIHIWWARRPLAACRAMNLACLLPDPADKQCPTDLQKVIALALDKFEIRASKLQTKLELGKGNWNEKDNGNLKANRNRPLNLRKRLLKYIGEYSNWDVRTNKHWNTCAQEMVLGCYDNNSPILLDSFAGGGSIPLEAMRVGAKPIATDLNPIPILINKFQLEFLPNAGKDFITRMRKEAERINDELQKELSEFYPIPKELQGKEVPIGYICARTIRCEGVDCGISFPLLSSPWVAENKHKPTSRYSYSFSKGNGKSVEVGIVKNPRADEVLKKTVEDGNATCPICGHKTPVSSVKKQLSMREGGTMDSQLLVIIGTEIGDSGRTYRLPTIGERTARQKAVEYYNKILNENINGFQLLPTEPLPPQGTLGFNVQSYALTEWNHLFTPRQAITQMMLCKKVIEIEDPAIRMGLAFVVSKLADLNCTLCGWRSNVEFFGRVFAMQTISMNWDFYEINPFNTEGGVNWLRRLKGVEEGIEAAELGAKWTPPIIEIADATQHPLPDNSVDVFATDPPYYDKVPYSNLSNFFIVWLKRMIEIQGLVDGLSPRTNEVIKDRKDHDSQGNPKTDEWYEKMVSKAMAEAKRITKDDGIGYVVYADKTTAGWATALNGLVDGGWTITGSWPIQSEMAHRMRAQRSAALKTSVHIVIRPRPDDAGVGDWANILSELPGRIGTWLARLNKDGIVGADAIYACLGPAMELFSKWETVEKADGSKVPLSDYLEIVWDTVANEAMKIIDPTSSDKAVEEDARFTMMVLWTLRQSKEETLTGEESDDDKKEKKPSSSDIPFDTASLLSRGIGASIERLLSQEVIEMKKSSTEKFVSLLSPANRRHYLLGVSNDKIIQTATDKKDIQLKLREDIQDAKMRTLIEEKITDIPKRDSALDKLHQAMLLHADGNTTALDRLITEVIRDDKTTWQLALTLNTLYPEGSWERSKIEGVLARYN
ncbi:MAG: DUF1156 domain-containing protein [Thermoplasmata archaeon]|nr:DUF1156 domain-containing protein [Thermoplasmata archaeon]